MAALNKITPPGKALHAEKLIPAAEAAGRPMRRRKENISSPPPLAARKNS